VALIAAMTTCAAASLGAQRHHEFRELHMGVEVRIVLYASDERMAKDGARAAFDHIAALEDIMSDYRPESEVRRLEPQTGQWTEVSEPLFSILSRAVMIARATDGAFDPTVAPAVALWRHARRTQRLPDPIATDSARALVGWRQIGLDSVGRRVRLSRHGMRLDLGGIAKGFIVHRALGVLRGRGQSMALIEAGGDIAVAEPPPGTTGWTVVIGDTTLHASNSSISTSGARYQFLEIGGVRYSHVIDPRTSMAVTTAYEATVIASDGATADALATAITILGPERGRTIARRLGAKAFVRLAEPTASARKPE
jgi:FAD:protein FMN transferase